MPLYKVTGRFWVALDLDDYISGVCVRERERERERERV